MQFFCEILSSVCPGELDKVEDDRLHVAFMYVMDCNTKKRIDVWRAPSVNANMDFASIVLLVC